MLCGLDGPGMSLSPTRNRRGMAQFQQADIGVTAVLHSWGQNLQHHPHMHCIVPGGGISPDGKRWIACRPGFFLPVRVLSRLFRRLFLQGLEAMHAAGELQFFTDLATLKDADEFRATSHHCKRPNGSSMPKSPSPVPSRSWLISRATRIAAALSISVQKKPRRSEA